MGITIAVAIWVLGMWGTMAALFWASFRTEVDPWRALLASILWFITLPLAWIVIARLREALPYLQAFAETGAIPISGEFRITTPPQRVMNTLVDVVGQR